MTAVLHGAVTHTRTRKQPSVLFVGNFHSAGSGLLSVCEELSSRLAASGWPIVTASRKHARIGKLVDMIGTAWQSRAHYDVAQIDLYSGSAFIWAEAVAMMLQRIHKPFVLTLHGGNLPQFAERWPRRVRQLLTSAAAVTAPSAFLAERMRSFRDDIQVLPNALTLDSYTYRLHAPAAPKLIWVRAFHAIYNPTLLPRVLSQLMHEFPDVHAVMVGPDKNDGSLQRTRELASSLGVLDRLECVGAVQKSRIPELLDAADVFVNTTNIDNTPVSVMEAMASGLCVVSTAVGGLPYLLRDGEDALLVPPNDEHAMSAAIRQVLTDTRVATQLSSAARARAVEFEWANILPQWETLLTSVAGGARG